MIKFEKMKNTHLDDNGEEYEGIDIIRVAGGKHGEDTMWICECGNWLDETAHFYADLIINALLEKFGEF